MSTTIGGAIALTKSSTRGKPLRTKPRQTTPLTYEGDDLVAGQGGDARADGEESTGHQQAAEIAREDDTVVGVAEVVDGDPERERERQRDRGELPRREKLPEHDLSHGDREREQELDGSGAPLLRPQPASRARG